MADDTTTAILAEHTAILSQLSAGQATIAQTLQALVGVVQLQQGEALKTSKALNDLVAGVRVGNARGEKMQARIRERPSSGAGPR